MIPCIDNVDTCKLEAKPPPRIANFDTEPALFMVSVSEKQTQENLNQCKEKAENVNFVFNKFGNMFDTIASKLKSSVVFQNEFSTVVQNHFENDVSK